MCRIYLYWSVFKLKLTLPCHAYFYRLVANAACWAAAGILFGRNRNTQPVLSLALLAWVREMVSDRIIYISITIYVFRRSD
jgi:hypothetical protein